MHLKHETRNRCSGDNIISRTHSVGGEDITPNFSIACKVKTTVSGIASTFAGEGVNLFRAKTYKLTTYKLTKLFFKWYMNV